MHKSLGKDSVNTKNLKTIQYQFKQILIAILVGFMAISLASTYLFFWPTFKQQDISHAETNALRVYNHLLTEVNFLEQTMADWSIWDDTYAFIQDGNEAYATSNLVAKSFVSMTIRDMVYMRDDGSPVWAGYVEPDGTTVKDVNPKLLTAIQQLLPVGLEGKSGLISIDDRTFLVSVSGVTDSEGVAPTIGALAMTREVNSAFIDAMRESLQVNVSITGISKPSQIDLVLENDTTIKDKYVLTEQADDNAITYSLAFLDQKQSLEINVLTPREVVIEAQKLFMWNGVAVLISALGMLWVIGFVLQNRVILPLRNISRRVEGWETNQKEKLELHHHESLEIGRISNAIVSMHGKIMDLASTDQLTGLPNRRFFEDRLSQAFERGKRHASTFALINIDLDGFKPINDTYGHHSGDEVLKTISNRLHGMIRATDTVARVGGDEFVILLEGTAISTPEIEQMCKRIIGTIEKQIDLGETECSLSASLGVGIYPNDSTNLDHLMTLSDQAMYKAKEQGKATYAFASSLLQPS